MILLCWATYNTWNYKQDNRMDGHSIHAAKTLVVNCTLSLTYTVESRYLEVDGTIFNKFKLTEVQINLHFG